MPAKRISGHGSDWSRDEVLLAMDLYLVHSRLLDDSNYEVQTLARLLGRSPGSVATKLANLRAIQTSGSGGLGHFSRTDLKTWVEFAGNREQVQLLADAIRQKLYSESRDIEEEQVNADEKRILEGRIDSTERLTQTRQRLYTAAVRRIALRNYEGRCCFCEINIPELLEAAHIRRWSEDTRKRVAPSNVLCLCVLHHKAFDEGLLGLGPDLTIHASSRLKNNAATRKLVREVEGMHMLNATQYPPDLDAISYHSSHVFRP